MTELLRRVIAELKKLPDEQQDAMVAHGKRSMVVESTAVGITARLLVELKDEQAWTTRFETTTNEQWERLAVIVWQDIANGETVLLDEVFPV